MKRTSKTHKGPALVIGIAVSVLALFAGEFTSHGETVHNDLVLNIDEVALIERAIEHLESESFEIEEEPSTTIKIFDKENRLVEILHLREGEQVEDIYTERALNKAEFLSSFGTTLLYQLAD